MDVLLRYNEALLPFRCGHVCTRALDAGRCSCPQGDDRTVVVLVDVARERGGPCGPEAKHMRFPK